MTNSLEEFAELQEFRFGLKERLYNWGMRVARQKRGMSQAVLAEATGLKQHTIGQIETLRRFPKDSEGETIAHVLGLTQDTLFPEWLKEFKLISVPLSAEEESVSLEEALSRKLIAPALLTAETGWEDDIERHVDLQRIIPELLNSLTPREKRVIELRFGLDDGKDIRTLERVGRHFGLTRERIGGIEAKALRKLRHPSRSNLIKEYIE